MQATDELTSPSLLKRNEEVDYVPSAAPHLTFSTKAVSCPLPLNQSQAKVPSDFTIVTERGLAEALMSSEREEGIQLLTPIPDAENLLLG